ncbi:hypothetical protein LUZ61_007697 [Rhynchospora tenuis]|uniref:Reverse transcriptase domain-containing protein n=1 Tax=Rhynchospora tenuis TaxID=198213 RepID=A0AAD6EWP9_9POAL|nr:hypothetical protein LUZ61_007697 [Rhynchospora tenuis]
MLTCVLSGSSKVVVNGVAGRSISLKRGVRQGDPLSPYLFILAMDFLARWLNKLVEVGAFLPPLVGIKPCLLYADDALFFLQPSLQQCQVLKTVLLGFQAFSGLTVNPHKSDILITLQNSNLLSLLSEELGCNAAFFPITYLGLPLSDKKLAKSAYAPLLAKFQSKLAGWSAAMLSFAGRLILLNSCLTALPIYFMSVFCLPKWVVKEIDKIRRNFLWKGPNTAHKKLILIAWDNICKPKSIGGLGVLDIQLLNLALISKWLWRWLAFENAPLTNLYNSSSSLTHQLVPANTTLSRVFLQAWHLFSMGFSFSIGSGRQALFWHHDWGLGILKHTFPHLFSFASDYLITVRNFVRLAWTNQDDLFMPSLPSSGLSTSELHQLLLLLNNNPNLFLSFDSHLPDKPLWKLHPPSFSSNSFYKFFKTTPAPLSNLRLIWKLKAPPRMIVFAWQLLQHRIPTQDVLQKRGWHLANRCPLCYAAPETPQHISQDCPFFVSTIHKVYQLAAIPQPCSATTASLLMSPVPEKKKSRESCYSSPALPCGEKGVTGSSPLLTSLPRQ